VNIFLTPYDVLRLRRALNMSSSEVLNRYTMNYLAGAGQIPVVQLAMDPETLYCKLVTEEGCSVYGDRPWACRMYPLDLASRDGEYTLITGKERCLGLLENSSMTVDDWLSEQGVEPYVLMEQAFHSVMPEEFQPGKTMAPGLGKILFLAYDLDRFADLLEDSKVRSFYEIDEDLLNRTREDQEFLLRLAFQYIRNQLEELFENMS
jgi:Fe-S-cluster containining protein